MADETIEVSVDESAGSLTEYFHAHASQYGPGTTEIYSVDGTATNGKEYTFTPTSGYNSGGHGHLEIEYPATVQINSNTFAGESKDFDLIGVAPNGHTLDYHVTINPDKYSLHLQFSQGTDSAGNIKPGKLTATLMDDTTGNSIYTDTKVASCDDAFPLRSVSGEAAIDSPESKISGSLGLVFGINGFARGTNQTDVELHVGSPQLSPTSADSESCLVVSQKNFLTPLEEQIAKIAGIDSGNLSKSQDLSSWINDNLPVTLSTKVGMSQPTLKVQQGNSDGQFSFHLSRPVQKDVAVIYSVIGASGKVVSTREAIVGAGNQDSDTVSLSDLRQAAAQPVAKSTFSNLPGVSNATYNSTFGKAANVPAGSQLSVKIDGYAVHLQSNSGKDLWYWDSKQSGSSSMANEKLMLSGSGSKAPLSLTVPADDGSSALSAQVSDTSIEPFVFTKAAGQGLISNFVVSGDQHSLLQMPSADFQTLAQVLTNSQNTASGVTITDPTNGSTLQIAGVTKAELKANKQDLVFS